MWKCSPCSKKSSTLFICNTLSFSPRVAAYSTTVSHQGHLQSVIRELFPDDYILVNSKKDARIRDPSTGFYMELDFYIPSKKISFEFQDSYHYATSWYVNKTIEAVKQKDTLKHDLVSDRGETMIQVPCWWDGNRESLIATIRKVRPDLLRHAHSAVVAEPIEADPPERFFKTHTVPGVGELMLAAVPPIDFTLSIDRESPWWIGEKYDGMRCCWNPNKSKLYTRHGLNLVLPQFLVNCFPKLFIDGEIWFGRGLFHEVKQFIQSNSNPENVSFLRIIGFDNPSASDQSLPFEKRYSSLVHSLPLFHPFLIVAPKLMCYSRKQIKKILKEVTKSRGEGVMIRKPKSLYEHGRSSHLLKLKVLRGDREALVIGITVDKSYVLQLPEGNSFEVKRENVREPHKNNEREKEGEEEREEEREREIKVGDVVTFSYKNANAYPPPVGGVTIERRREDVEWREVVMEYIKDEKRNQQLNKHSKNIMGFAPKTYGSFVHAKRKQIKRFFESIAKNWNLDPLLPESWYSISLPHLKKIPGVKSLLKYFGGSAIKALIYLFPDISLESSKFSVFPRKHWDSVENRRSYFTLFARENQFDTSDADQWRSTISKFGDQRVRLIVRHYYHGDIGECLIDLFPEIGFKKSDFRIEKTAVETIRKKANLYTQQKCKNLFSAYARSKLFDPLVPANWYNITPAKIFNFKGGRGMLAQFKGSVIKVLYYTYPNIGLQLSEFAYRPRKFWNNISNRKIIFDKIAAKNSIDPLSAEEWYKIPRAKFTSVKELVPILTRDYNGNYVNALIDVYPEIGLEKRKFTKISQQNKEKKINIFS